MKNALNALANNVLDKLPLLLCHCGEEAAKLDELGLCLSCQRGHAYNDLRNALNHCLCLRGWTIPQLESLKRMQTIRKGIKL